MYLSSILFLFQNSRPSSPAEGAVSKFSPSYHQNVKFNVSASLPSVFVESMDGCEKYQRQTETVHCSSDNNLKTFMQTNETSLTDSLRSFERHEVRCDLLSNSGTFTAGMKLFFLYTIQFLNLMFYFICKMLYNILEMHLCMFVVNIVVCNIHSVTNAKGLASNNYKLIQIFNIFREN